MKRGRLLLYVAPPGFRSACEFARIFAGTEESFLTSSANSLLTNIYNVLVQDDSTLAKLERGALEVLPFNEFIRKLAIASETPLFPILSLEYQRAFMALACQSIPDEGELAAVKAIPGFHAILLQIVRELHHHRIPLDALKCLDGSAAGVGEVLLRYSRALKDQKMGTLSERIEDLLKGSPPSISLFENLFWFGEEEIPPLWCELIRWLRENGVNVHLLVEVHPGSENFFTLRREMEVEFPDAEEIFLSVPLPIAGKIFAQRDFATVDGRIEILEAGDGITECEWAMRAVLEFLHRGGKPNEVAIFCRSISDYAPHLYFAARRLGLSLKMEFKEKLLSNPFVRTVMTALQTCLPGGWHHLYSLFFSPYCNTARQSGQTLERILQSCAETGDLWQALGQKLAEHPNLLPPWLAELVKWRNFAHLFAGKIGDWCDLLSKLLGITPWLDTSVQQRAPTMERDLAAQDAMIRSLRASVVSFPKDARFSASEFINFVEHLWRNTEYTIRYRGDIPVVTEAKGIGEVQLVVALGMVEGRFPRRRMEVPILNDRRREALAHQNPKWRLPTSYERARSEEHEFYRLICSAPNLLLCYPNKLSDHHEVPAFFLSDLREAVPGVKHSYKRIEQRFPIPDECLHLADLLPSIEWYRESLREQVEGVEQNLPDAVKHERERFRRAAQNSLSNEIEDEKLKKRFVGVPRSITFSLLRSLARCRFQYFARANLKFSAARSAKAWRRWESVIQGVNLLNARTWEDLRNMLVAAWESELERAKFLIPQEEWEFLRLSGRAFMENFAYREFRARREWGLVPVEHNVDLSKAGFRSSVKIKGIELTLHENVDVLYRKGDDLVPMRLGYAPLDYDRVSLMDNALLLSLIPQPKDERISILDDVEGQRRLAIARSRLGGMSQLPEVRDDGLLVNKEAKSSKELLDHVKGYLEALIEMALSGDINPSPGIHCERCALGSLCRWPRNSTLLDMSHRGTESIHTFSNEKGGGPW
ncbi:MAG: hypothetical protein QXI19_08145 [Candidatus Caldarchaeum sp.]